VHLQQQTYKIVISFSMSTPLFYYVPLVFYLGSLTVAPSEESIA